MSATSETPFLGGLPCTRSRARARRVFGRSNGANETRLNHITDGTAGTMNPYWERLAVLLLPPSRSVRTKLLQNGHCSKVLLESNLIASLSPSEGEIWQH